MMTPGRAFHLREMLMEIAIGAIAVAMVTAVCYPPHLDFAFVGCLYLLLIVLESTFASFTATALVSVIAVLCLDYFFVPPLLTLDVDRPADAFALVTFLVTALVTTRLATKAREEARKADTRRADFARLYELAFRLVSVSPFVAINREYLGIFRQIFDLRAACLFDGRAAATACDGESKHNLEALTRQAYVSDHDYESEEAGIAIRCLRVEGKPTGAVGFEGLREAGSTAGPLSALAAAMMQRARAFEAASEAAVAEQIEVLRSAVLDAFAHQFKTPLATILAAAGTLRETGPLVPEQEEMVETIESQAAGVSRLTTRLLRMARLDRDEIKPKMRTTDLAALVGRVADQYRNQADGRVLVVEIAQEQVEVPSDPDMLSIALIQLLENAIRYSPPASTITVRVNVDGGFAMVRLTNEGNPILPEEQNRIFDRFYRGRAARQTSGTGLGLYVARKIVLAHGGALDLDKEHKCGRNTTFCLKLPIARQEYEHELKAS